MTGPETKGPKQEQTETKSKIGGRQLVHENAGKVRGDDCGQGCEIYLTEPR